MRSQLSEMGLERERWLLTGASGQLGGALAQRLVALGCGEQCLFLLGTGPEPTSSGLRERIDLGDHERLRERVLAFRPTRMLHVGAMTAVGACAADPDAALAVNATATRVLAEVAEELAARLVFTSTDMVFDGSAAPYAEEAPTRALSVYGRSKVAGEAALAESKAAALVVRLPLMVGLPTTERRATFRTQCAALRAGDELRLFTDEWRTPIWISDAADALLALAQHEVDGVLHVAGPQRLSRYDIVARVADALGVSRDALRRISRRDLDAAEPRPEDLSLDGTRFRLLAPEFAPRPMGGAAIREELASLM